MPRPVSAGKLLGPIRWSKAGKTGRIALGTTSNPRTGTLQAGGGGGGAGKPLPSAGRRARGRRSPSGPSLEGRGEESWADKGNRAVRSRKKRGSERGRGRTDRAGSAGLRLVKGGCSIRGLIGAHPRARLAAPALLLHTPFSGPSFYS